MEYYGHNDYRSYLAHHGIKGMLKDLGYSDSDAEKLVTKMQKANRTLGFV